MKRAAGLVASWVVMAMLMLAVSAEVIGRRSEGSESEMRGRRLQVSMLESIAYSSYAGQQVF